MRCSGLAAWLWSLSALAAPAWWELAEPARREHLAATGREELEQELRTVPPEALVALARRTVVELNGYKLRLVKHERVRGQSIGPVEMLVTVRERPYAVSASFVGGLGKGRRALYNPKLRAEELRVREPGIASILGALWIGVENPLTRRQSNHSAKDLGFGYLVSLYEKDFALAREAGGVRAEPEGFDERGSWCVRLVGPRQVKGLYAYDSRYCIDLAAGLPTLVEVRDEQGLYERYAFFDVEPVEAKDELFTPEHVGL